MRLWAGGLSGCVGMLLAAVAPACPCGNGATVGGPLTRDADRVALLAGESLTLARGAWDARGRYSDLDADQGLLLYVLGGGYRPIPALEIALELTFAESWLRVGAFETEDEGLGDTRGRIYWDTVPEPMPYSEDWFPAVSLFFWLRAPTGSPAAAEASTGSLGTTGAGLGAWEATLGTRLSRALGPSLRLLLSGEVAERAADHRLGVRRKLGPRALGQIGAEFRAASQVGVGLSASLSWEGEVTIKGDRLDGTAQRLVTAAASVVWTPDPLRLAFQTDLAPPVDGLSANAIGSVRIGWTLSIAR